MKQEDIDDAIDSVAHFVKIFVRRAVQETDKAATVVAERFHQPSATSEDDPATWGSTLGTHRFAQPGVTYHVLAFSRMVGKQALMRVSFQDGSTGEYPLQKILSDPLVSGEAQSSEEQS